MGFAEKELPRSTSHMEVKYLSVLREVLMYDNVDLEFRLIVWNGAPKSFEGQLIYHTNIYNARSLPVSPKMPMDAHSQCIYGVVGSVSTGTITSACQSLTHWDRDKMATILKTILSNAFSWMKMYEFRLEFHWSMFLRVQWTIFQHWFR